MRHHTLPDAKQLVIQAFKQAKDSGKPDWYRMTTAVLKNRLLALTAKNFSEQDYGASSLANFVTQLPEILIVDSNAPHVLELNQQERAILEQPNPSRPQADIRIKGELWRAIFDRSSGNQYYWLSNLQIVSTSLTDSNSHLLPTIDADIDRSWRQSFVDSLEPTSEDAAKWAASLLPLSQLPQDLRRQWHRTLTHNVHRHLLEWFNEQQLQPPRDFVTEVQPVRHTPTLQNRDLRQLVIRVVQEMTEGELSQLTLPAHAVFRAMSQRAP